MKDARSVLDGVRSKIPPNAQLFVVWTVKDERGKLGVLRCAQANLEMGELEQIAENVKKSAAIANATGAFPKK